MANAALDGTPDGVIVCVRCTHVLASAGDSVEIAGARVHRDLVNPGGHRFTIACVSTAPGCTAAGPCTRDDCWFSGCAWQRAFCRGCTWHVGWIFRSPSRVFWGLDTERASVIARSR